MAKAKGSVRIGPISIFTLIILLCLAVLAVLAVSTAHATYASADKQARFTTDTYANEGEAQSFLADVDAELAQIRKTAEAPADALAQLSARLGKETRVEDGTLYAAFTQESGRTLTIGIALHDDLTYEIVQWKATTEWKEDTDIGTLWPGNAG